MRTLSFLKPTNFPPSVFLILLSPSAPIYLSTTALSPLPPFSFPPPLSSRPLNERVYLSLIGLRANRNKQWLCKQRRITAAVGKNRPHTAERACRGGEKGHKGRRVRLVQRIMKDRVRWNKMREVVKDGGVKMMEKIGGMTK